jgi:hypothetical protein
MVPAITAIRCRIRFSWVASTAPNLERLKCVSTLFGLRAIRCRPLAKDTTRTQVANGDSRLRQMRNCRVPNAMRMNLQRNVQLTRGLAARASIFGRTYRQAEEIQSRAARWRHVSLSVRMRVPCPSIDAYATRVITLVRCLAWTRIIDQRLKHIQGSAHGEN